MPEGNVIQPCGGNCSSEKEPRAGSHEGAPLETCMRTREKCWFRRAMISSPNVAGAARDAAVRMTMSTATTYYTAHQCGGDLNRCSCEISLLSHPKSVHMHFSTQYGNSGQFTISGADMADASLPFTIIFFLFLSYVSNCAFIYTSTGVAADQVPAY
ncbi:hypothetical protein EDC04DRAFT_2639329 [Pisolithus marmoratus]|nr:hypothetical protein EDC04DRAFT_2639329 [Pisolithus marmoratus]